MKYIATLILISLSFVVNASSVSDKTEYASMGAKDFYTKHCKRACVEMAIGVRYIDDRLVCKMAEPGYKNEPSKYKWLDSMGNRHFNEFRFSHQSYTFINWQASQALVLMDSGKLDFSGLHGVVSDVIWKSTKEVKRQCESVGGTFKQG